MTNTHINADLVVLGGGPGGYPAAFLAADLGMDVVLIDPDDNPGGVCLYRGCIPSKALLHVAKTIRHAETLASVGVAFDAPRLNLKRLRDSTRELVASLTGGLGQLVKARKIRHLRARGRLKDARTIALDHETDRISSVAFNALILATGSSPNRLPHAPDTPRIWSSDDALTLSEVPERLLVIGGGYIGLELGTVYAALGSSVSVVEMADSLLPGVDPDLTRPLRKRLDSQFEEIRLETKAAAFAEREDGLEVELVSVRNGDGGPERERFDRCLVAVGRRPNTADIGREAAGVELDARGFVKTDHQLRTTQASIFAIGDVAGPPMLAHTATHQGRTVVEAIHGKDVVHAPRAFPAVVFTDPEIAWCGVTEQEAKARELDVRILRFPHAASGRARTLGDTAGLTKLVADAGTGRILGAGIVGPEAGELIGEAVLAVELGATATDLALSIHPNPTMSETLMEAAETYAGHCTHFQASRSRTTGG